MPEPCEHVTSDTDPTPTPRTAEGCEECLPSRNWVHLRLCVTCGHVGCCDDSPGKHASTHHRETSHPVVRSYEPREDWWWCFVCEVAFDVAGAPPAPSHP